MVQLSSKGADFSISGLSALASTYPQATTFRHLGITEQTSSQMTTAIILQISWVSFSSVMGVWGIPQPPAALSGFSLFTA